MLFCGIISHVQRYKLTLSYEGTLFAGWQVQKTGPSIQTHLQKALETTLRHPVAVTGAGRTDAGVHAWGQTAHIDTPHLPSLLSINALLPPQIRLLSIDPVPSTFHARYSATGKIYQYRLRFQRDPFQDRFRAFSPPINLSFLQSAIPYLIGTHDFFTFANENHKGTAAHDSVRTLRRLLLHPEPDGLTLTFEGDGFLYKMVRNLVGTLMEVGRGKRPPSSIPSLLASHNRSLAGPTAPPEGLHLISVLY